MSDPLACLSRRDLIRSLAAVGVTTIGAGILVACSSEADPASGDASGSADSAESSSIALSDVPVGEARVVDVNGSRVVIAQPTEGTVVAFTAECTHQGTIVEAVGGLVLRCPLHGSEFDAADGVATKGPAVDPLSPLTPILEGDRILIS